MNAGYKTLAIAKKLIDDGIIPVIPYTRPNRKTETENPYYKRDYIYDEYFNCYICPEEEILTYSTTDRNGYRIYKSKSEKCKKCSNLKNVLKVRIIKK